MRRTIAWERLNDHNYAGNLSMAGLHSLMREAGYTEEVAQQAAKERAWTRLDAGMKI